ncbi:MAG TPA: monovalent cation/H(+) antiporter subunit G [Candidatus Thermoplasmatota archaeon]|nr:monovalent cation/H(+) antiporter subunit G [Candidatus Thermoplasmatota archaeon]
MEPLAYLTLVPLVGGILLLTIAGLGVLRMPDVFLRMQAASKASSLGAALVLAAVALHYHSVGDSSHAIAAIVLLFITIPVSTHLLARAAYLTGVPLWKGTVQDELAAAIRSGEYVPPVSEESPPPEQAPQGRRPPL